VYVPAAAPPVKVARLRAYGAEVTQGGDRYADAYEAAAKHAARSGALFCHAYDQPEICAGEGTLGLELLEQADAQVDTVGGGGLLAGVAAATEGRASVAGIEPTAIPTLHPAQETTDKGCRSGGICCVEVIKVGFYPSCAHR